MKNLMKSALLAATTFGLAATLSASAQEGPERPDRGERMVEKLDTNGDGNITKAEVDAHKAGRFAEADANGDGSVTAAELSAFAEAERAERRERRQAEMFKRLDTDGNGSVSEAEFLARPDRMFERADANGDGVVTAEEREAVKAEMKDRPRRRGGRRGGE